MREPLMPLESRIKTSHCSVEAPENNVVLSSFIRRKLFKLGYKTAAGESCEVLNCSCGLMPEIRVYDAVRWLCDNHDCTVSTSTEKDGIHFCVKCSGKVKCSSFGFMEHETALAMGINKAIDIINKTI